MILINDTPGQPIDYTHPDVRVVNLAERCGSLGEKLNIAIGMARGEVIVRWDDDDISLPWRLERCVELATEQHNPLWYATAHGHWYYRQPNLLWSGRLMASCWFSRDAWKHVGGFPLMGVGEDQKYEQRLQRAGVQMLAVPVEAADAYYLYRWNDGSTHVSGLGPNGYDVRGRERIVSKSWSPQPAWSHDYVALAREAAGQKA